MKFLRVKERGFGSLGLGFRVGELQGGLGGLLRSGVEAGWGLGKA